MAFLFPKISSSPLLVLPHPNPSQNNPSRLLLSSSALTKLEPPPVRDATREKHPALHGKSPAALQETKKKNEKNNSNKDDFYLNLGLAVRTLRDELPFLFSKDLNYDIYRDDITFVDPLSTFHGIENYKLIFWALRFHGRILFREIGLEIFRVWQPSENMILIRWELQGVPRVPWEARGRFQGTSRYRLDRNGKIYEHKVDNLAFNFPRMVVGPATVMDLVAATCPPSPNLTFRGVAVEGSGVLGSCSWVELYRAVRETVEQEEQLLMGIGMENFVTCS